MALERRGVEEGVAVQAAHAAMVGQMEVEAVRLVDAMVVEGAGNRRSSPRNRSRVQRSGRNQR